MKYIIVVDKQSRTNPSSEKRETTIEIDELLRKGEVHDDFIIDNGIAKVIRRLGLSEYNETYLLDNEVVEELGEIKIKLFEGDNYIYIKDEYNNNLCAEYIVKSDFTDNYVTKLQMSSAIEESARQINLSVTQTLENYSTTEETKALIKLLSDQIALELTKKVNDEELTGASIILRINENTSSAKISADMIILTANDVLNIIAGNTINLTSKNIAIASNNFSVDKDGKMTAKEVTINGGIINLSSEKVNDERKAKFFIKTENSTEYASLSSFELLLKDGNDVSYINAFPSFSMSDGIWQIFAINGMIALQELGKETIIDAAGITTPTLTQTSEAKFKENIEEFYKKVKDKVTNTVKSTRTALDVLKDGDIYKYNFKGTNDQKMGLVIGDGFNCPQEIINTIKRKKIIKDKNGKITESDEYEEIKGIDLYSMTSICWQSLKEQQEIIENLIKRIEKLEAINND